MNRKNLKKNYIIETKIVSLFWMARVVGGKKGENLGQIFSKLWEINGELDFIFCSSKMS
jgi:hypothetical protein